ncbi:MAG: phosphatase PAP2 family protein [Thermoleophilaceae bacterium]
MLRRLDLVLLRLLQTKGHQAPVERAVLAYTHLGEHGALWHMIAVAGTLVHPGERHTYTRAVRVIGLAYLANIAVKYVVRRARPLVEHLPALSPTVSALSFPSAHSTTAFAAAAVLRRALPSVPLYAGAGAMALSRVYVGVHYPSDIAAGAAFGTALERLLP